jgi:hypothetical protein
MIAIRKRDGLLALLLLLVASCKAGQSDPREELRQALKGSDVNGYVFTFSEDDAGSTAAFTNPGWRKGLALDKANPRAVLRYTRVRDKKRGTTTTYRAEAVPSGQGVAVRVTDLDRNVVVSENPFVPVARFGSICTEERQTYSSLDACLADFNCACRAGLQCEANRRCETILADIECCFIDSTGTKRCPHPLLIIKPNTFRCEVVGFLPDEGSLALSR